MVASGTLKRSSRQRRRGGRDWTVTQVKRNVHIVEFDAPSRSWERRVFCFSDAHWDNPHCKRSWLQADLNEMVAEDAPGISNGDFYCCMQGNWDKRSDKSSLRPEHQRGDYLDALVNTGADWLEPYAKNLFLLGYGNHETSIIKRHESWLLDRLTEKLRSRGGITTAGGYCGWVRFIVRRPNGSGHKYDLYYAHGTGGATPVTLGTIEFNRKRQYVEADAVWLGHVHHDTTTPIVVAYLNGGGVECAKRVLNFRTSTYKDEFFDHDGMGYHNEQGRGPRPICGKWLRLYLSNDKLKARIEETECHR